MSKVRLTETLKQLNLNAKENNVIVRIHTAIHLPDEAVDLARFIKRIVPQALILGTSTSAVIYKGKCLSNQCIVSVTQMNEGTVKTWMSPLEEEYEEKNLFGRKLAESVKENLIDEDTKMILAFFTPSYKDVSWFVVESNEVFPGVQMIGGITDSGRKKHRSPGSYSTKKDGLIKHASWLLSLEKNWSRSVPDQRGCRRSDQIARSQS